ncbi:MULTISPECIES: hypothetical protein [unclassified Paenibacillus]|uniref:hypothetical protein n=1 Tax=unclassified Paenibacillus TaxID=185978 RepID=UPI00363E5879
MTEIVKQCVEKGILKSSTVIIDATHTSELLDQLANIVKKDDDVIIPELGSVGMVAAADKGERNNEKYILFDHDGVLVDTEFWYYKCQQKIKL